MFELNEEQRATLLRIARQSIAEVVDGRSPDWNAEDFDETLRQPAGAFVTLTRDGDLRGCIGSIQAVAPLYNAVVSSAVPAAVRDPRCPPLSPGELDHLDAELSETAPAAPGTN